MRLVWCVQDCPALFRFVCLFDGLRRLERQHSTELNERQEGRMHHDSHSCALDSCLRTEYGSGWLSEPEQTFLLSLTTEEGSG